MALLRLFLTCVLLVLLGFIGRANADVITIDDYLINNRVDTTSTNNPAESAATPSLAGGGKVLGGWQYIWAKSSVASSSTTILSNRNFGSPGSGAFFQSANAGDQAVFRYDGTGTLSSGAPPASTPPPLNPIGLRNGSGIGVDLTSGGTNNALMLFNVATSGINGPPNRMNITVTVYTDETHISQAAVANVDTTGGNALEVDFLFSGSAGTVFSGNADFTNVGAILLQLEAVDAGMRAFAGPFAGGLVPVPEPGAVPLLGAIAAATFGYRRCRWMPPS